MVLVLIDGQPALRFLAHPLLPEQGVVSLGFFGLAPDQKDDLLQEGLQLALPQCFEQLGQASIRRLVGPMNGNTWFAYRLRVDEHPLQFDWEPPAQPRLQVLLERAGFTPWGHYHSIASAGLWRLQEYASKDWQRALARGFTLRRITAQDLQSGALQDIHRLSQVSFADNPLFAPLSFAAFTQAYLAGKLSKENYIYMAYDPQGRAVAFFLAFLEQPHTCQEAKTLVLKTAGTDPEFRRQGLSNALIYALCQDLPPSVSDQYISALVFQGLSSESYARHGSCLWEHHYQLLAKDL